MELMANEMQTIPRITPKPKTAMKAKPNGTELTVVNVTSIRAALPAKP
jgi:hypothetical protein